MTKEQQDLSWASLPKEVREEIRNRYKGWIESLSMELEVILYSDLFGAHNLTSDTEPPELLFVEREKIVELYSALSKEHDIYAKGTTDRISLGGRLAMIQEIFGDKCLPDKDISKMETTTQPSVQVEPKFPIGSIV